MFCQRFSLPLRVLRWAAAATAIAALTGCAQAVVLNPAGDIAAQQGQLDGFVQGIEDGS